MRHVIIAASLVVLAGCSVGDGPVAEQETPAAGQQPEGRQRIDVSRLGPQVGERVPDFRLLDQHGTEQTLQSLSGPEGLMLVFLRSADW